MVKESIEMNEWEKPQDQNELYYSPSHSVCETQEVNKGWWNTANIINSGQHSAFINI